MAYASYLDVGDDLEDDDEEGGTYDIAISKELAKTLYDKAGGLVKEDENEISIPKYQHLLNDNVIL